jgi:transposase-like protein
MTISRAEVITSVERRRRWSQDEKERLVAASLEPGASVSEVAHGWPSCKPAVQVAQRALQAR